MAEHLQPPFNNVDPATAADPRKRERCAELMLAYIYHSLPDIPLYDGMRFTALAASRGADRLSRLPCDLLRNVLARLPVKDAARTAVLSSRWRALWRSTPLVLADIHLLPKAQALRPAPANSPAITAAVSRILEAHPGPFACVHLICSQMDAYRAQLARWLQLLAAKGVQDLAVVKAPRLERLILEGFRSNAGGLCTRVTIGDAPKLQALGILEPGNTILEIGDAIDMSGSFHFQAGIKASPSSMATSVKFLSLNVRFKNHTNAKMVPSFLACFPNLEALHIMSEKCDYEAGSARLNLNFWKLVKPPENVKSCIKVFSYKEFRGELGEVAFLKFFFRSTKVLRTASVSMANPSFTSFSMDEATHKAQEASSKMVSSSCEMVLLGSTGPEGGKPWSFKTGTDYSFEDPFSVVHIRHKA